MGMSAIVERIWVPSAAVVPQERGPEFLEAVDGADWSEGVGFNRGFFSTFRIRAGKTMWFHFPFPTPVMRTGKQLALADVSLIWETLDGARIIWLVLQHGGVERHPLTERLAEPASTPLPYEPPEEARPYHPACDRRRTTIPFDPPMPLEFGVQLCVGVSTGEAAGTVRFYGAGLSLVEA